MKNKSLVYCRCGINNLLIDNSKLSYLQMPTHKEPTFGELIQEALTDLGWKNAELARRTGFSATHIGNLIRDYSPGTKSGKPTRLPPETVDKIADALKRPRAVFRRAAGLAEAPVSIEPVETVEEVLRNAFLFGGKPLSDEEIEKLRPFMEMLDREIDRLRALKEQQEAPEE